MEARHSDIDSFGAIHNVLCKQTTIPYPDKLLSVLDDIEESLRKTSTLCDSAREKATDLVNYCTRNTYCHRSEESDNQTRIIINIWSKKDGSVYQSNHPRS